MSRPRSYVIDQAKERSVRHLLEAAGYNLAPAPHAFWRASNPEATITFFKSGKLLLQGKAPDSAANLLMNAGILTEKTTAEPPPEQARPPSFPLWIGTDESGKGDYFGPLTVAGVLATRDTSKQLLRLGTRDSKQLSDSTIKTIAPRIKQLCPHSVATITPKEYNALYLRMKNLNRLLAWGHARVIEAILSNHPCSHAITDQFADEKFLRNALMEKGRQINLTQRNHAEDDTAVASASILAREAFLTGLESLSLKYHIDLPKGASHGIIETGQAFVARYGKATLEEVAKVHFATTKDILDPKSESVFAQVHNKEEFVDFNR